MRLLISISLRPHQGAQHVYVTGTFDDWGKSEQLQKVGQVFEKEVQLSSADEKILYKFVVDDQWVTDPEAPKEDDGHYNVNNVLYPGNIKRKQSEAPQAAAYSLGGANPMAGGATEHRVTESSDAPPSNASFDGTSERSTPQTQSRAATVSASDEGGAPTLSQDRSEQNANRSIPDVSSPSHNTTMSSEESKSNLPGDSEKSSDESTPMPASSQSEYASSSLPGAFPETPANEPESFSVNPIPASSGFGNPVRLQPGDKVPEHSEVTSHTVDSTVTTSKEDYDRAGSASFPMLSNAASTVGSTIAGLGQRAYSALPSAPEVKEKANNAYQSLPSSSEVKDKVNDTYDSLPSAPEARQNARNLIPESSLPMGSQSQNTMDAGPFVSSAGPGTTTSELAAGVPLEKKRQAMVIEPEDAPEQTASAVPDVVKQSLSEAHQDPEAAASSQAVQAKGDFEEELLAQVSPVNTTSESVSTSQTQTSHYGLATGVPQQVEQSIAQAHASPEAAAEPSAVHEKQQLERELLGKVSPVNTTGDGANTSQTQTSHYGLATGVPQQVEESMAQAHASPEAAAEPSAVHEKQQLERELLEKVPVTEEAGEPAPTESAALSATAPGMTQSTAQSDAEATVADITDGFTANEPIADTDTSTTTRGPSAGDIAGGAAVGGLAVAGTAAALGRHRDADEEPPRIPDEQKPDITTEYAPTESSAVKAAPNFNVSEEAPPNDINPEPLAERTPGQSSVAGAAVSDGAESEEPTNLGPSTRGIRPERSDADQAEYAPPRTMHSAPGVSASAAAAISDGTEDPTLADEPEPAALADEPAVRMMQQNEVKDLQGGLQGENAPGTGFETTTTPAAVSQPAGLSIYDQITSSATTETSSRSANEPSLVPASTGMQYGSSSIYTSTPAVTSTETPQHLAMDSEPVVSEPVVEEPIIREPVASEPVVSEPVVSEPVVSEPVVSEWAGRESVNEPILSQPAVKESAVSEPVTSEPAAEKSAVGESTSRQPTVSEPVISEPAPALAISETAPAPTKESVLEPATGLGGATTSSSRGNVPEASSTTQEYKTLGPAPTGTTSETPKKLSTGSASSSPSTSQRQKEKKKSRISGFFKKIFD